MEDADVIRTNAHVRSYLDYYTDPEREFDFAVLLSGPWGSGKTRFIKDYLSATSAKPLYVSLYGLTRTTQIEEEFYRKIHPVLSSKGMRVVGAIARGALKGTLKIDLNKDGQDDGSWNINVPEIDLTKEIGNPNLRLLVFDDVERCQVPINELLGYINSFVEHDHLKTILVANESEILRHADNRYREIKEKLIGQTLTIAAPVYEAYDAFVETVRDTPTVELLKAHKQDVVDIYRAGGDNNLRLLKQALWDLERISCHCEARHWANPSGMMKMLKIAVAMSFEHRSGRLQDGQLERLLSDRFGRFFRSYANGEKGPEAEIEERYPHVDFENTILDAPLLEGILLRGESDGEAVRRTLNRSAEFASLADRPLWERAWDSFNTDDDALEQTTKELEAAFANREFIVSGEMLHVFGIRLWFQTIGLLRQTRREIVDECKAYVDDLESASRLPSGLDEPPELDHSRSYASKGFMEGSTPEFQELARYYAEAAHRISARQYLNIAIKLLKQLEGNTSEFVLDLVINGIRSGKYHAVPVLAALPSRYVAEVVSSAAPDVQMHFLSMLHSRHESPRGDELRAERGWVAAFQKEFSALADAARPMARYRLQSLIARNLKPLGLAALANAVGGLLPGD